MKIIENGNKTYTKFQSLLYNDVFRCKYTGDIYIKVPTGTYYGLFNAWGLTNHTFTFFDGEEEVEVLEAELHIKS